KAAVSFSARCSICSNSFIRGEPDGLLGRVYSNCPPAKVIRMNPAASRYIKPIFTDSTRWDVAEASLEISTGWSCKYVLPRKSANNLWVNGFAESKPGSTQNRKTRLGFTRFITC